MGELCRIGQGGKGVVICFVEEFHATGVRKGLEAVYHFG